MTQPDTDHITPEAEMEQLRERAEEAEADRDIAVKALASYKAAHLNLQHDYHHALADVYAMWRVRAIENRWYASDDLSAQIAARILNEAIGHREGCKGRGKCRWMEHDTATACRCNPTEKDIQ